MNLYVTAVQIPANLPCKPQIPEYLDLGQQLLHRLVLTLKLELVDTHLLLLLEPIVISKLFKTGGALVSTSYGVTTLEPHNPEVKVISTGYPDSNTMVVDGGTWSLGSNQDKIWSDGFSGDINPSNPGTNAFDGNLDTYCSSVNQGATQTLLLGEELTGTLDFYNVTMTGKVITKNGSTVIHEQNLNAGSDRLGEHCHQCSSV